MSDHAISLSLMWAGWFQVLVLIVTALFVRGYLKETEKLRKAAQAQVEAAFRPAIVMMHSGRFEDGPLLENIGSSPALDIQWVLKDTDITGAIGAMKPHQPPIELPLPDGVKPLYDAALKGNKSEAFIDCTYRSLSGVSYKSSGVYNIDRDVFTTTLTDSLLA